MCRHFNVVAGIPAKTIKVKTIAPRVERGDGSRGAWLRMDGEGLPVPRRAIVACPYTEIAAW